MLATFHRLDARLSRLILLEHAIEVPAVRFCFLVVEWLAHGIPWLLLSGLGTLIAVRHHSTPKTQWWWCVLLFGILIDLVSVGIVKIVCQRSRPSYNTNDQVYEAPVADKFSFPSGHSSRATMLTVLALAFLPQESGVLRLLVQFYPFFVGFTRVAMGRHFLFDVLAGFLLGCAEGFAALQLPRETPRWLVEFLPFIFVS